MILIFANRISDTKNCESQVCEAIRVNRSNVLKIDFFRGSIGAPRFTLRRARPSKCRGAATILGFRHWEKRLKVASNGQWQLMGGARFWT